MVSAQPRVKLPPGRVARLRPTAVDAAPAGPEGAVDTALEDGDGGGGPGGGPGALLGGERGEGGGDEGVALREEGGGEDGEGGAGGLLLLRGERAGWWGRSCAGRGDGRSMLAAAEAGAGAEGSGSDAILDGDGVCGYSGSFAIGSRDLFLWLFPACLLHWVALREEAVSGVAPRGPYEGALLADSPAAAYSQIDAPPHHQHGSAIMSCYLGKTSRR